MKQIQRLIEVRTDLSAVQVSYFYEHNGKPATVAMAMDIPGLAEFLEKADDATRKLVADPAAEIQDEKFHDPAIRRLYAMTEELQAVIEAETDLAKKEQLMREHLSLTTAASCLLNDDS